MTPLRFYVAQRIWLCSYYFTELCTCEVAEGWHWSGSCFYVLHVFLFCPSLLIWFAPYAPAQEVWPAPGHA